MTLIRTIAGLTLLSQKGSRQNAHQSWQRIQQRRATVEQNREMTSAIADMAPNSRAAILAIDIMADHSAQTPSFLT